METTNSKITVPSVKIKGKEILTRRVLPTLLKISGLLKIDLETKWHMNPYEFWYKNVPEVKNFMDKYFEDNLSKINFIKLKSDCELLITTGNVTEKCLVLSLLGAVKYFN